MASDKEIWQRFHVFNAKIEKKYTPLLKKAYQQQLHAYINYANDTSWEQAALNINTIITTKPIEHALRPLYRECASRYGWVVFRDLKTIKRFFSDSVISKLLDAINAYFDTTILSRVVIPTTEYTKRWVQQQIIAGLQEGNGYDVIARSMVDSDFNLMRARRITRTETVRASNATSLDAARLSRIKLNKRWSSAQDNRTRVEPKDIADHYHMNGITIALDDYFSVPSKEGVTMMAAPGDIEAPAYQTINCRCCISYVPVRGANGRVIIQ